MITITMFILLLCRLIFLNVFIILYLLNGVWCLFMRKKAKLTDLLEEAETSLKNKMDIKKQENTYKTYWLHCRAFIQWAEKTYHCTSLKEARVHVPEWLSSRESLSINTRRVDVNALSKLYSENFRQFIRQMPNRDKQLEMLIIFTRATGLTKPEICQLKSDCLVNFRNESFIRLETPNSVRLVPIIENKNKIIRYFEQIHSTGLWNRLPRSFDYAAPRIRYMSLLYKRYARNPLSLEQSEKYFSRSGHGIYDKYALFKVAQATDIYDFDQLIKAIKKY